MGSTITTRAASAADASALALLIADLGYTVSPEDLPARVERFRTRSNGEVLVAVADAGVVGFAALDITFPVHHAQPVAHLSAFAVSAAARRQGVGRCLLAAVEEHARGARCARVVVASAEHRADAHAFYVAAGWPYRGRRFGKDLDGP